MDDGNIQVAIQGESERARNGRGGHHQQVRIGALAHKLLALGDAELMLFVNNNQAELFGRECFLQQSVRADEKAQRARAERSQRKLLAAARADFNGDPQRFEPAPEIVPVLFGQDFRRRHQRGAGSAFQGHQGGAGGHHRFARTDIALEQSSGNFAFIDTIVGGTIPTQFVPAVEKGCKELLERGALGGYRIQDVAVEVFFGKYHDVDSSEAAFKTAGRIAFKNAFLAARPVLLEPVVVLEVTAPSKYTGAILGDLNTKRARVENQDSLPGDLAVITAKAPLAEVARYAAQLGSITQGQGSYHMEFSHYDQVPGNVQQQIVSKSKMAADEDE